MVKTIGNPLSWGAHSLGAAGRAIGDAVDGTGSHDLTVPEIRSIGIDDLRTALRLGVEDFKHFRSDVPMLVLVYPLIGVVLALSAFHQSFLPLIFPMIAGFALLGPVAAVAFYELSRQRDAGAEASWITALAALRSSVIGPVMALGVALFALFVAWIYAALAIYNTTLGPAMPDSLGSFARDVLTTGAGWSMVVLGIGVGAVFAAVALVVAAISLPMLIDRRAGLPVAVTTSVMVCRRNPGTMAAWGLTVAVLLALGSLPAFAGLVIVLPVLGHATWHLYRAAVPARKIQGR